MSDNSNHTRQIPSIFNDVIGPIMRGPSSSHCAAALRIGRLARDLMDGEIREVLIEFDPSGSLATTHQSQGSDMGLFEGLLGWNTTDERLIESEKAIHKTGIKTEIKNTDFGAQHPNTYKLILNNQNTRHEMIALSTGSGMIEIISIDGVNLSICGDYHETLLYIEDDDNNLISFITNNGDADHVLIHESTKQKIVEIKSQDPIDKSMLSNLQKKFNIQSVKVLSPVLPVLSRKGMTVPFLSCAELSEYNKGRSLELWELAVQYESARGDISREEVFRRMMQIVGIMRKSIHEGIQGTEYKDRILGCQSGEFKAKMEKDRLLDTDLLNRIILYVTAMMEMKSSMGVIVAAPTAGACGALPGACIGAAEAMGLGPDEMIQAMLAAGMVGIFIAANATFAAEVGGCQAECGAGSGMAAAALVTLAQGSVDQATAAASMALQNILGMVCDPVANRVEVPCLGKNVMAASNALACANMALAGYDPVIPLDEVIETMDRVGKSLPSELKCTALGGLSITKTSKEIEKRLKQRQRGSVK